VRQAELAVLDAGQERGPLAPGVDVRCAAAILGVANRDAAAGQVRHLDARPGGAAAALEPVQIVQAGFHPRFLLFYLGKLA
jgi:hypothetical protein